MSRMPCTAEGFRTTHKRGIVAALLVVMVPSLASLCIQTDAQDLGEFLSLFDNECFNCEQDCDPDDHSENTGGNVTVSRDTRECRLLCKNTQADIKSILKKTGATTIKSVCGNEGQVSILTFRNGGHPNIAVKVMVVDSIEQHKYRETIWKSAHTNKVGPSLPVRDKVNYVNLQQVKGIEAAWYSFVYMEELKPLPSLDVSYTDAIGNLIDKTANAGFLHTDSHTNNIMTVGPATEQQLLFIDWEAGILGIETDKHTVNAAKRLMWSLLWNANQSGSINEHLKDKTKACGEPWTTITEGKQRAARVVLQTALDIFMKISTSINPFLSHHAKDVLIRKCSCVMIAIEHNITLQEAIHLFTR